MLPVGRQPDRPRIPQLHLRPQPPIPLPKSPIRVPPLHLFLFRGPGGGGGGGGGGRIPPIIADLPISPAMRPRTVPNPATGRVHGHRLPNDRAGGGRAVADFHGDVDLVQPRHLCTLYAYRPGHHLQRRRQRGRQPHGALQPAVRRLPEKSE